MDTTRRVFLRTAAAAVAGSSLARAQDEGLVRLADFPPSRFTEPETRHSSYGLLQTSMRVGYAHTRIGNDPVYLRSYEGALVGPTLRFRPGDTVKLDLFNNLPDEHAPMPPDVNIPHQFNTTNLHTHGLHVSPSGNSDNVLLSIEPGEHVHYQLDIPRDHPPGTYWYHAHRHGSTSIQLGSGMAGALVIEGDIDEVPEIAHATERTFVFQQIPYDENGQVETFDTIRSDFSGKFTTINGQAKPVINMRPGEVQRWRLIHGGIFEVLDVRLEGHELYEIAVDGITTGRLDARDEIELGPGYRSDVLVKAGGPGEYVLSKQRNADGEALLEGRLEPEQDLAIVVVAGPPLEMDLPDAGDLRSLAPFEPIEHVDNQRRIVFAKSLDDAGQPLPFNNINGKRFDPEGAPLTLRLGAADEWTLSTERGNMHPFHIHVNPFEVTAIQGEPASRFPQWRDTILVRRGKDVTIRSRYTEFTGRFVMHCHILMHEDEGMMQLVEIVP